MSKQQSDQSSVSTFWWVLAFSIVIFAVFYFFEPERQEIPADVLPWNSHYDDAGKLHALGLVLGQSSTQDVITVFDNDYEAKVFSEKDESHKTVEIQFPQIRIATIRGALFLKLDVPKQEIDEIYSSGVETTVTQTGQRAVTPNSEDTEKLILLSFSEMTFIPRKNLNERALQMRFGEPDRIEDTQDQHIKKWIYPNKGLTVLFNTEGPEAFQYQLGLK